MSEMPPTSRYRFDRFEIDLHRQELLESGEALRLPPQPWKVLEYLVRNADRLVTRDELQEHLWGDRAVEVDSGLNYCIRQVRQALGESAETPAFIRTVPRRGYRFIAEVEPVIERPMEQPVEKVERETKIEAENRVEPGPPDRPAVEPRKRRRWSALWLVLGATVLVGLLLGNWERLFGDDEQLRMALLPLTTDGLDEESEWIAVGVTRELVTELGRLDRERVEFVSLDASRRFHRSETPAEELREVLGVEFLLRGSVSLEDEGTRVHLWLERTEDRALVWTHRFDSGEGALLATQRDLGEQAVTALASVLGARLFSASARTEDPRERRAYLRGKYLLERELGGEPSRSIPFFEEAITADPSSARAHAGLAEAILKTGVFEEIETRGRAAALRAIHLDPSLPEPHMVLSWILASHDWNWDEARQHIDRALTLDPDASRAHAILGYYLLRDPGGVEPGLASMRRAQELDPISSTTQCDLSWAFFYTRRFAEAEAEARAALLLNPNDLYAAMCRVYSLRHLGREAEAVEAARALMELRRADPAVVETVRLEGGFEAAMDAFWRWWSTDLERLEERGFPLRDAIASVALELGDHEEALRQLGTALEERSAQVMFLDLDPRFDALRGDPRFDQLIRKVRPGT